MTDGVSVLVMEIAWSRRRLSASALCSPPYELRWLRSAKTLWLVSFCQNLFRRASPVAKSQKEIGRFRSPPSRRPLKALSTMGRDNSFHRPRGIPPSRKLSLMENIGRAQLLRQPHVRIGPSRRPWNGCSPAAYGGKADFPYRAKSDTWRAKSDANDPICDIRLRTSKRNTMNVAVQ